MPEFCGFSAAINHFQVTLGVGNFETCRHTQIKFEVQKFRLSFATCCLQIGNQPVDANGEPAIITPPMTLPKANMAETESGNPVKTNVDLMLTKENCTKFTMP